MEESFVHFYLFTYPNDSIGVRINSLKTNKFPINPSLPVKILCHGWLDDKKSYWYEPTVSAYLRKGGVNVITTDWGKYAKALYCTSFKAVSAVGYFIALLITELSQIYGIPLENFHVIGHSLGSHIAGFAGKNINAEKNRKIGRITGLDPAGPSFIGKPPEERLCSDDAVFVDVIHTDAGGAGYKDSLGHVDFYPNGGTKKQNGCKSMDLGCSHKRAPIYFAESINNSGFVAAASNSYKEFLEKSYSKKIMSTMGEYADKNLRGDFYLNTNPQSPYAMGVLYSDQ